MTTVQTVTVPDLARAAEALNFPTQDAFACSLWRLSNCGAIPRETAAEVMRECGYIPFCGLPLARSGKIRTMTFAEVLAEQKSNPLCNMAEETLFIPKT